MTSKAFLHFLVLWVFSIGSHAVFASPDAELRSNSESTGSESELSLAEVLDLKVSVFGNGAISNREAPAVTSVITREELLNAGVRELQDALDLLVPGYSPNSQNTNPSMSVRGIESFSGKILLMFDGVELNDRALLQLFWTQHYNLDNVRQIEIIRGPGSAVYGGAAELTVINVISRDASQNAAYAILADSEMSRTFYQRSQTVGLAKQVGDFYTNIIFTSSMGNGSQSNVLDNGSHKNFSTLGKSQENMQYFNWHVGYKGLSFRTYINEYGKHFYGTGPFPDGSFYGPAGENYVFQNIYELKYDFSLSKSIKIKSKFSYQREIPWNYEVTFNRAQGCPNTDLCSIASNLIVKTTRAQVAVDWAAADNVQLVTGVESDQTLFGLDLPSTNYTAGAMYPPNPPPSKRSISNLSLFYQGTWYTPFVNVTAGARYDQSNLYASSFVPRLGLTKALGHFNAKLLAGQGYRVPPPAEIQQENPKKPLEPEKSTSYEAEVGYQFTNELWAALNFFDLSVNRVIQWDELGGQLGAASYFENTGSERTQGIEAQLKYKSRPFDLSGNYSYYAAIGANNVSPVAGHPSALLGAPNHKINLIATSKPFHNFFLVPYIQYLSTRYYELDGSPTPHPTIYKLDAATYFNINIRYRDLFTRGLELSCGVLNVFNRGVWYPESTTFTGVAPTPGPSRRFMAQLTYSKSL